MVQAVLDNCAYPLHLLGRDPEVLKKYTKLPYPRISYKKAIEMLQAAGMDVKYGDDFGSPEETYLSDQFDQPVFVLNYPKAIKPFYMLTDPEDEQQYVCADMLAPEGYGEIIGGSERETDYDKLKAAIEKAGLDPTTMVLITNSKAYARIEPVADTTVEAGADLLAVQREDVKVESVSPASL